MAALERDFPDQVQAQPELIAYHATNAEQLEAAVGYWCKAGERGLARAAMKEANAVYSRALDIVRRLPPSDRRERTELEILLELGRTQQAIRGSVSDECGRTFGRARQLAERSGRAEHLVEALKGLMYFHHGRTELNRAAEVAGARLEISKRLGLNPEIVAAYDDLATVSFSNGDFQNALDLSSSASSIIEAADRYSWSREIEDAHRSILILWAQTMTVLGFHEQALAACDRAMSMARAASHDYTLVTTLGNVCFVDQVGGRDESLAERAEEMVKVSTRRGFPTWLARGLIFGGWRRAVHLHEGAGLSDMRDGLARLHTIGAKVWRPYYLGLLAHACGAVGQPRAGLEAVAEAMAMAEPDGEQDQLAELHRIRGALHSVCGDRSAAEACFQQALAVARRQKARLWELRAAECLARLWADAGQRTRALDLLSPVYGWFTEGLDGPDLRRSRDLLHALG